MFCLVNNQKKNVISYFRHRDLVPPIERSGNIHRPGTARVIYRVFHREEVEHVNFFIFIFSEIFLLLLDTKSKTM